MNKNELLTNVAELSKVSIEKSKRVLESLILVITQSLKNERKVKVHGLVTISKSKRKAYRGRNPKTGQAVSIPARNIVRFKMSKTLGDALN
jgi:DNA-binding protein HU-beta